MSTEETQQYVSLRVCRDRHATSKWLMGILAGLMAVFLTGAIYAVNCANQATTKANGVSATLQSHMAAQIETERYLRQRLDEIRADIHDNRALLHEILRNGKKEP